MQLTWSVDRLALRTPLRISRGTTTFKDLVVVELEHDGLVGYGEAAATLYYRQPLDSLLVGLAELRTELDDLTDPYAGLAWLDHLVVRRGDQPVLVAALDVALHDWIGKQIWQPVHRFLGLPGGPFQTAFTL